MWRDKRWTESGGMVWDTGPGRLREGGRRRALVVAILMLCAAA